MQAMKFFILLTLTYLCISPAFAIDLAAHPNVRDYIQNISNTYQFDPIQLNNWFKQIEFIPGIKSKEAASKRQPYYIYRELFITPARIQAGVTYWQQHKKELAAAQKRYGVPATVIVGILGVETGYGVHMGTYSTLAALSTGAFQNERRSAFFMDELTQYLLLCREQNWHPLTIRSSYAGAIGMPQFMPSSYRQYAVSTNKFKKNADLLHNDQDVIHSVAHYLKAKGWQTNQPVVLRAQTNNQQAIRWIDSASSPLTLTQWQQHNISLPQKIDPHLIANALTLQGKTGIEHWLAFKNFSVIKRYNNSTNYAMTVYELGNIIVATAQRNLQG